MLKRTSLFIARIFVVLAILAVAIPVAPVKAWSWPWHPYLDLGLGGSLTLEAVDGVIDSVYVVVSNGGELVILTDGESPVSFRLQQMESPHEIIWMNSGGSIELAAGHWLTTGHTMAGAREGQDFLVTFYLEHDNVPHQETRINLDEVEPPYYGWSPPQYIVHPDNEVKFELLNSVTLEVRYELVEIENIETGHTWLIQGRGEDPWEDGQVFLPRGSYSARIICDSDRVLNFRFLQPRGSVAYFPVVSN